MSDEEFVVTDLVGAAAANVAPRTCWDEVVWRVVPLVAVKVIDGQRVAASS
jgi:hypothetical protein